ncbi:MAG: GNAT family N-acetyltransferase [Thermoplasmatota archaeon]
MSEVLVRRMLEEDMEDVASLWMECGLPYKPKGRDSPDNLRKGMELHNNLFLVALIDDGVAGSLLVTHDGRKGWMNRLGVLPRFRHQGAARALIEEGERWLSEQGIGIFACIVEGHNKGSMEAMRKLGYLEFEGAKYFTKRLSSDI